MPKYIKKTDLKRNNWRGSYKIFLPFFLPSMCMLFSVTATEIYELCGPDTTTKVLRKCMLNISDPQHLSLIEMFSEPLLQTLLFPLPQPFLHPRSSWHVCYKCPGPGSLQSLTGVGLPQSGEPALSVFLGI